MSAPPISPIPTYDRFIEPLLRLLASRPEGVPAREAHEAAADALGLDAAARQQLLSSGAQLVYKNRAGWAHDRLKRAGLSDSPRRGWWQLTEAGRRFVAEHAGPLSAEQVATLAMSHIDTRLLRPVAADAGEAGDSEAVVQPVASPEERLGLALEEIRRAVVAELLDTLATVTPAFFETLVLDLLHRMGYGANRADLQRVGGSGDAGGHRRDHFAGPARAGKGLCAGQALAGHGRAARDPGVLRRTGGAAGQERRLHHHVGLHRAGAVVRAIRRPICLSSWHINFNFTGVDFVHFR